MNNNTCINVLKILATALVYFCHSWIVCKESFDYEVHGLYWAFITPAWAGVWIFLVVGGFLAAHGFYGRRYSLDLGGVIMYYKNRIVKILIPTWIFISLGYIFIYQEKTVSLFELIQWFTCTFNGYGSLPGIGASWYVFIVMWLYFMAPFITMFISSLEVKYQGNELKLYVVLIVLIASIGGLYRVCTYFFLDWYNWTYANLLGCMDLFVAGMFFYRLTYFLPCLSDTTIKRIQIVSMFGMMILIVLCLGFGCLLHYGGWLYMYIWATGYLIVTGTILMAFSYKVSCFDNFRTTAGYFGRICNVIAPYTFTYYLWHSFMLMYVAALLKIDNDDIHFLVTTIVGILVSSYIAFIMAKMNKGIVKSLMKS